MAEKIPRRRGSGAGGDFVADASMRLIKPAALTALVPFRSRAAYEEAAAICGRLSVRKLTAVQREYFQELLELVEAWEDDHGEADRTLRDLRLAAARN